MKVRVVRNILQKALDQLEGMEDTDEIDSVSNTYFLGNCNFLGIKGHNGGFVNIDNIRLEEDEDEDDWD